MGEDFVNAKELHCLAEVLPSRHPHHRSSQLVPKARLFKQRYNKRLLASMASIESPNHSPSPPLSHFPQNPEEFDADSRVSFSKLANKFILEADNGEEFEFDDALERWVPVVRPHPYVYMRVPMQAMVRMADSNCMPGRCWIYSWTML